MTIKNASKWMSILSAAFVLAACGNGEDNGADEPTEDGGEEIVDENGTDDNADDETGDDEPAGDTLEGAINAVTREEGSGTRDAFEDIFGIEEGELDALNIQQGTGALMTFVGDDLNAIGYTSTGSLNDDVKALSVDGVEPTSENIASGDYTVFRTFNVMYGEELNEVAQDFWDFIFSAEGQAIVEENGYVAADADAPEFTGGDVSGDVTVGGSTSVFPVMEQLAEAYQELNGDVNIEIQESGSGSGVTGAQDGTLDIGMASREVTDEEMAELTAAETMAIDGIAIIVNPDNPIEDLTLDEVNQIFTLEITDWSEIQ
jgi:phosphate transport system substrate-binding protein